MPNPMPPADRKHGTGDRNDAHVAHVDHKLQEERDARETPGATEADREAKREEGFDHP
ncbi:hypothetical protein [Frateuria soli]|uniref:hypothetical protein n=1 Tax=Frateuria soli TaxID=1542730 RepID=UPI001E50C6A3|nr:hypothetical protein [Frateuria soli]UGB39480.1 hypothetical protein LQ771_06510 [Frateuria soli]